MVLKLARFSLTNIDITNMENALAFDIGVVRVEPLYAILGILDLVP